MVTSERSALVERYILANVEDHGADIARRVSSHFGISRQAANRHLQKLVARGALTVGGKTRSRVYGLQTVSENWSYNRTATLEEHIAWHRDLLPHVKDLPKNVLEVLEFGFTEMFNNAVDHSEGVKIHVHLGRNANTTEVHLHDDGIGIFRKIMDALDLPDERHAVLELAKGKFTTDPSRHSGEGIFFTSRMFDPFVIMSEDVQFSHQIDPDGEGLDLIGFHGKDMKGTAVIMSIGNDSKQTLVEVFSQFSSGENKDFTKTIVPVMLAQYGSDRLISRSQGKRIVAGLEHFKTVVLDFKGIDMIGQGFADQIFRVFHNSHPEIDLIPINCKPDVLHMIERVTSALPADNDSL